MYKSRYQPTWQMKWPCVAPANGNPYAFHCNYCHTDISCGHQGEKDVTQHMETARHQRNIKSAWSTAPITQFSQAAVSLENKVILVFTYPLYMHAAKAEVKTPNSLKQHNIPLAFLSSTLTIKLANLEPCHKFEPRSSRGSNKQQKSYIMVQ